MKIDRALFHPDYKPEPFWWEAARPGTQYSGDLPDRTEIFIVGSGYSGLSAALELARGGRTEGVEGTPDPDRIVLIGFADTASVRRFHGASEYAPLIEIRHNASTGNVVAMEAHQP